MEVLRFWGCSTNFILCAKILVDFGGFLGDLEIFEVCLAVFKICFLLLPWEFVPVVNYAYDAVETLWLLNDYSTLFWKGLIYWNICGWYVYLCAKNFSRYWFLENSSCFLDSLEILIGVQLGWQLQINFIHYESEVSFLTEIKFEDIMYSSFVINSPMGTKLLPTVCMRKL